MKKLVRLFALTLVLAGSFAAASTPTLKAGFLGGGDPAPLCDPDVKTCPVFAR